VAFRPQTAVHPAAVVIRRAWQVRLTGDPLRDEVLRTLAEDDDIAAVLVEVNQGGDLWRTVLHDLPVRLFTHTVSESKEIRFARALKFYQRTPRRVRHAVPLPIAEGQMVGFPRMSHDDVADAVVSGVLYFLEPKSVSRAQVKTRSYV
jgi:phage terminase large subunit-like protein